MFPSGVKTTAPVDKNAQQLSKTRAIRTLSVKTHVQGDKKRAANNIFGQAPPTVQPRTIRGATKNTKKLVHLVYWTHKNHAHSDKNAPQAHKTHAHSDKNAPQIHKTHAHSDKKHAKGATQDQETTTPTHKSFHQA